MTELSAVEMLKRHLLDQGYRPGDRLETEMELAERFGISRGKVREATTMLCEQGYLERRPRAGTRLKRFDPASLSEALAFGFLMAGFEPADAAEARRVLELAMLPLVIKRIRATQLQELRETVKRMTRRGVKMAVADKADRDFHLLLLAAAGNETLKAFAGVIQGLFNTALREPFHDRKYVLAAAKEHEALIEAIAKEDVGAAEKILKEHLHKSV